MVCGKCFACKCAVPCPHCCRCNVSTAGVMSGSVVSPIGASGCPIESPSGNEEAAGAHGSGTQSELVAASAATVSGAVAAEQPSSGVAAGAVSEGSRCYCPVEGCVCNDPARHPGWKKPVCMINHINAHLSGRLQGIVPDSWMRSMNNSLETSMSSSHSSTVVEDLLEQVALSA